MKENKLKHIAFIMDGNGRWAKNLKKPRIYGHAEGVKNILQIVELCIKKEIEEVSFFAFSTENWNRSKNEVDFLMNLLYKNLSKKTLKKMNQLGVFGRWIGFENNLSSNLISRLKFIESESSKFKRNITINLFFNYSGKQEILNAIEKAKNDKEYSEDLENYLITNSILPIDLLIRTSGEQRISNFCLYKLAYSEIIFEKSYWPDYNSDKLIKNIDEYYLRDRRFGKA